MSAAKAAEWRPFSLRKSKNPDFGEQIFDFGRMGGSKNEF